MSINPAEMAVAAPAPLASPGASPGHAVSGHAVSGHAPGHARQGTPPLGVPPVVSKPRSWLRRRWWLLAGAAAVVVAGVGVAVTRSHAPAPPAAGAPAAAVPPALAVTVAPVVERDITRRLLVTGSLAARDELPIGTETSGLAVTQVLVDIGDHVKKGQLLARFNDDVLKADLAQRKAEVVEAQGNAAEADANLRRAEELFRTGAMSGRDLDNRRALAISMGSRVAVAQANRDLAEAKLRQAEIRAPADGTITARTARLGAVLSAGGTELFRMIRDDQVELVADVPESDLPGLKPGQTVALSVDGSHDPGRPYNGTVRLVDPTVDPKTRIGHVRIDIEHNPALKPGMFVTGEVAVGTRRLATVPEGAVVYRDVRPLVFVIDAKNQVDARQVNLGGRQDGYIGILSGVRPGERVAVTGAGYLKQGDTVIVAQASTQGLKPLPPQP